jgi:Sulfotransferase family
VNPYVFIVGCPRSGTTLVQRLANAHPELAVAHETRWIVRCYEQRIGLTADDYVTPELVMRLPQHSRFKALKVKPDDLARVYRDCEPTRYAEFVSVLFDRFAAHRGKPLAGDKSPMYVRALPTLHSLWPKAKFVHIIRDGRDVCLSVLDWQQGPRRFRTWTDDPIATTAVWWDWNVRLGREAGRQLGPDLYHELRYEALIDSAEEECTRLCSFLGIPYDGAMLRFHEGRMRDEPGLDAKKAWRPVTAGLRNWREQMTGDEVARFETAAAPLLNELGYAAEAGMLSDEHVERAARVRKAIANDLRARGRPVPAAWANGSA